MTGGGGKRKAAELSDRHADLADKAGVADRRAQQQHIDDGLLSIEAAEAYLEAGALSNELSHECSRGELMWARRRAGLTAKRSRKLMQLADDWHGRAADLYAAFNRTEPFSTEGEARRWRDDMAREGVNVLLETRADWQARTRGLVDESQTQVPGLARTARWFGTFYTGLDNLLEAEALAALLAGESPDTSGAQPESESSNTGGARDGLARLESAAPPARRREDARNADELRGAGGHGEVAFGSDPETEAAKQVWIIAETCKKERNTAAATSGLLSDTTYYAATDVLIHAGRQLLAIERSCAPGVFDRALKRGGLAAWKAKQWMKLAESGKTPEQILKEKKTTASVIGWIAALIIFFVMLLLLRAP